MAPTNSLGVTALLDELLQEEAQLNRAMDTFTGRDVQSNQEEAEEPQLSAEDQRQLAELHVEVDGCLASLGNWEEESRIRRAKLEKELELEFGFSCNLEGSETHAGSLESQKADDEDEDEDMSRYLGAANRRRNGRAQDDPLGPLFVDTNTPAVATCAKATGRDKARHADVERIANLRAEVQAMKHREVMQLGPYGSIESDDVDATAGITAGLNSWCEEVDGILAVDSSVCPDVVGLTRAREGLNEMDSGLDVAQTRVNDDILEMEKLLAECGAHIQARKSGLDN